MKPISGNIFFFKRPSLVLVLLLATTISVNAQHPLSDTIAAPPAYEDSTTAIGQTDTGNPKTNYFDQLSNVSVTDTVQLREVPAAVIDSLRKDDAFWYADKTFGKKKMKEKEMKDSKLPSQWMNMTMLVIIVVIFIGLLAWYLFQNNIIRRKQRFNPEDKEREISEENIFDINYQQEIEKAIDSANYRLAIRLLFLRLLKNLSQKNIIQYKQERTNFDYLSQLSSGRYYKDFFRLTRNYEYAWYGKFDVSKESFGIIKTDFENFDRKL
jgi:hypothetical protein